MTKKQLLTEHNSHIFICGQTRSGKTFFASEALARLRRPVLFFNIQDEKMPSEFMRINYKTVDSDMIIKAIDSGSKLDLQLPLNPKSTNQIIGLLINSCMAAGRTERDPMYIALDEAHLLREDGLAAAEQAAMRGLHRGIRLVIITQRPATCSKILYTQASEQYIFYLSPAENQYIKSKGLDYEQCRKAWLTLGKYSYCYYDGFNLEGRRSI